MSSCKLRSVELMERADEVRRAEQRREIEKKMEDFLVSEAPEFPLAGRWSWPRLA